jgi:hypothetical protein
VAQILQILKFVTIMANVALKVRVQIELSCVNVLQGTLEKLARLPSVLSVAIRTKNAVAKVAVHVLTVFVNVNTVGVVMRVTNQAARKLITAIFVANQLKAFATPKKDNVYVLLATGVSIVMPKYAKRMPTMG